MQYRREIDGLRSVAVIPVILFHAGFYLFSGGYVGVDIFFVISGYLITSIINQRIENNDFSIVDFYERRARRIIPALSFVMIICLLLAVLFMVPDQIGDLSQSLIYVAIFCSNIFFWKTSGYFSAVSAEKPLLHTWSLAVEEQYYLVFPLLLLAIRRWAPSKKFEIMLVIAIASLILSEWASAQKLSANFYLAPTRAWELLVGSLCALVLKEGVGRSNGPLAAVGLGLILFSIFAFDADTPIPSLYAIAPVGGAALVILFSGGDCWVTRLLSIRPLVGIGLVSYSAYLWHQPLFAFARIAGHPKEGGGVMLALSGLSLFLAAFTWRYVERPFRDRQRISRRTIFVCSGLSSVFFIAVGISGYATNGFAKIWAAHQPAPVSRAFDLLQEAAKDHAADGDGRDVAPCIFNVNRIDEAGVQRRINTCHSRYGGGVAILGDSHAIDLFGIVASRPQVKFPFIVGVTQGGCRPHTPMPSCQYDDFVGFVSRSPGVFRHIVFEQAGFYLLRTDSQPVGSRAMFTDIPLEYPVKGIFINKSFVEKDVEYLERLARYVPTTWFGPRFEPQISNADIVRKGCNYRFKPRAGQVGLYNHLDDYIKNRLEKTNIGYISQIHIMNINMDRDFINCKQTLWSDGDHYSRHGQAYFAERFDFINMIP